MIGAWMLAASLFALWTGAAAVCGEHVLRLRGRQGRASWVVAIAIAEAWPVVAVLRAPSTSDAATLLPAIRVSALVPASLTASGRPWLAMIDRVLLATWLVASLTVLVKLIVALVAIRRMRRVAERRELDGVPVLLSDDVGPAVVGIARPEIVYPRALLALDPALRDLVLRHESEHRLSRDGWIALGAALAVTLMPWNPALWWMTRRARLALELDCDARVLREGVSATLYGKLLLLVAQQDAAPHLSPALISSRTHLERRVRAMLTKQPSRRTLRLVLSTAGLVVGGLAAWSTPMQSAPAPVRSSNLVRRQMISSRDTTSENVFFEFQVEKQVTVVPGSPGTRYPEDMRAAHKGGEVLAQFVVDAQGAVLPGSFKVLKSTHPSFTRAVAEALPAMQFTPAEIGGRKVKQLVQQPFIFTPDKAP